MSSRIFLDQEFFTKTNFCICKQECNISISQGQQSVRNFVMLIGL